MSLLEKAKQVPIQSNRYKQVNEEEIELVKAWLDGEITSHQAAFALTNDPSTAKFYNKALNVIREAYKLGKLTFKV